MIKPLGDWSLLQEKPLGKGGYATVYLSQRNGRRAALKVFENPHFVNTFEQELRGLQLTDACEGTPRILDYGRDKAGKLCIVTEYVAGTTLKRYVLKHGTLGVETLLEICQQLLDILHSVHATGLIHKDIKPTNVLFDGKQVTLIDWGVSELVGDGHWETIRANRDYVAPECFYGLQGVEVDFYALAWTCHYALTGRKPFDFDHIKDKAYPVVAHTQQRPLLSAQLPDEVLRILYSWLRKSRAERQIHYNVHKLLAVADGTPEDFVQHLTIRQINYEWSYFFRCALAGVPYAQFNYAVGLLDKGREAEVRYWLEQASGHGYIQATRVLAFALLDGKVSETVAGEGLNWLERAAEAGDTAAEAKLGQLLRKQDDAKAKHWLTKAADKGYRQAQYELGAMLAVNNHLDDAKRYMEFAAERGHQKAICWRAGMGCG
jgi:serine/threonine protein kinase